MKNEFTHGPWELQGPFGTNDYDDSEGYYRVAGSSTLFLTVDRCSEGCVAGQNFANARLIAAAPELLEALEWAMDHFDGNTICNAQQEQNCIEMCRNAVSKARGAA